MGFSKEYLELNEIVGLPDLLDPFFVVMITTPLAARDPYKAVAAPPLSTLMDSIIFGSISLARLVVPPALNEPSGLPASLLSIGTPSITNKAVLSPTNELLPRIVIWAELPGIPLELVTWTPATFPASALTRLSCLASTSEDPLTS